MKALIKVGYGCNNHCTFCHTLDVREIDGASSEVHAKIERAARLGHSMIVLSGGEVTMRSELLRWAAHSHSLGMSFGLVTNGRMLAYPELVEKLLEYRLEYVYMSLHGGTAKIHNLMVRADAFDQTYAAIANLSGKGIDFTVNTVVTRQNLAHLKPMVDAVLPYPDVVLKFSMVQPKGGGEKLFDHLIPPIADVAKKVHEAITYGLEKSGGRGPKFAHDGIPLCLLPGYEDLYDDLKTHRFWTMIEIGEPDFFPVDDKNKTQTAKCLTCSLRGPCPGLYSGYLESFGDDELRPVVDRPRSNSFNYVLERAYGRITASDPRGCPVLRDGVTPWDRGRHVFVRKGDAVAVFRTDSRDFADVEIESIKHEHGQLYVDVSDKPAPDDFARDLRQLRRSAICATCTERDRCAGLFELVRDDVFTRDDAYVRELLASLRGAVLDLGCGEGPYAEALAANARRGDVTYLGFDPDPARIEALRAKWAWAELRVGDAETADLPAASFDHVLVLRSWNHLRDPARVLRRIGRALRPEGTLTVVDNIAFGLVRTKPQAARGESSAAVFEHYRNDTAADAHAQIQAHGFALLERRDIGPGTSNQWMLRYRSPALAAVAHAHDAE
jgi:MoaA/NifB/PqqE/SkfB family radical SAM enzyme/SAM-dependent methyltransferase